MPICYGEIPVNFSSSRNYDEESVSRNSIESDLSGCDHFESDDSSVCWTDLQSSWDQNREYPMDDYRNVPPQPVNGASPISYLCLNDQPHSNVNTADLRAPNRPVVELGSPAVVPSPQNAEFGLRAPNPLSGLTTADGGVAPALSLESYNVDAIDSEEELLQFKTNLLLALNAQQAKERQCEDETAKYREQMMRISTYLQQECGSIGESLKSYEKNNDTRLKSTLDQVLTSEYHQAEAHFCKRMNKIAVENPKLHIRESKNIADAWDNAAGLLEVVLEDQFLLDSLDTRMHSGLSELEDTIRKLEKEKAMLAKQSSWLLEPISA